MIWFGVFFALMALSAVCLPLFVPSQHIRNFARCRKDATCKLAAGLFHAIWIAAVIQFIAAPSFPPPAWAQIAGAVTMVAGYALLIWARRVNPFFLPAIARPDYIVTTGPYAWIDHPGYTGWSLAACGGFMLLAQPWAFFPAFAYLCLIIRRIHVEERLLSTHFQ